MTEEPTGVVTQRNLAGFLPHEFKKNDWRVEAIIPGGEIFYIEGGFTSYDEALAWIRGEQRSAWLKERGWERWDWD